MKSFQAAVVAVVIASGVAGCSKSEGMKLAQAGCPAAPVRTEALDNPNKHAWDLFLMINQPAQDKTKARGQPDCTKAIGTPGATSVWETWRNAGSEVFLQNGAEPPEWQDTSLPDEKPGSVPPKAVDDAGHPIISMHVRRDDPTGMHVRFSPNDGVFNNQGGFGETRMNPVTYRFIRDQCLFSRQGMQRYAVAVANGTKPPISFPSDAIEVKAAWLDFDKEKIPKEKWGTYYTASYQGKTYGLSALHILTKDMPNWFWASFHHKDTPANPFERKDTYGQPRVLAGTVWANYSLGGVQTDFVEPTGAATRLSDYYVEFDFQKSSCMTCHATATLSQTKPMPNAQDKALCAMDPDRTKMGMPIDTCPKLIGADAFKPGTNQLLFERGTPDPHWFEKDGKPYYLQTDFVWAIPSRARDEMQAPPARCIWPSK